MTIAVRRKNGIVGKSSRFIIIPSPSEIGETSTIVVSRLLLADPRGEIPERDLMDFMETCVEPAFYAWIQKHKMSVRRDLPLSVNAVPGV